MAIYHKTLEYHGDTTVKREMNHDDIEFLLKLQHEMNTQDTTGTADPRFWVIKGSEKVKNNDDPDEYGLCVDGTLAADSTEETVKYLNEQIFSDWNGEKEECKIYQDDMLGYYNFKLSYKKLNGESDHDYLTKEEVNELLSDYGYDDVEVIGIEIRPFIYPNTMFITEKEAREHLESNDYHYSEDAHTYCMCAWRSPDVERLWKILREVKWDDRTDDDRRNY